MRVDVPTLRCDRCGTTTQDTEEMGRYQKLTGMWDGYAMERQQWDLCPSCWDSFIEWLIK